MKIGMTAAGLALGLAWTGLAAGAELTVEGPAVRVSAGPYNVAGRTVTVKEAATLPVAPSPTITVTNETLRLSADRPQGWAKGTRLRGCNARDVNASGSFVPGSLVLRRAAGGDPLKEGTDYLVDAEWGHVGLAPGSSVTTQDTVVANYRCALLRMDTIQVSASGNATLKPGEPHVSAPVPPEPDAGCTAIAHFFVHYRDTQPKQDQVYPILETPAQAVTRTTAGRIPKTLAKLKTGGPVTIVCWGDSVTVGGNASKPELAYPAVFAAGLRERFPNARIEMKNISAGGSNSRQWLSPDEFRYRDRPWQETGVTFQRVLDARPDLVTMEFVNDAGMTAETMDRVYGDLLQRVHGIGAEMIFITPHFTMWRMMGFQGMREAEKRPYVLALRDYAQKQGIALADASGRWEHLWKEGIPYTTLLHNTINHPDDRGHRLFAEELWKCFE